MHTLKEFSFPTLEHAWAGLNEYLANELEDLQSIGGGIYGTEICLYNAYISVDKAWINPEFDFGHILGYTNRKWSKLVSNYVDMDYLELVKAEVNEREKKKSTNYTHAFHFANKHGSGKDCLISLTFCRAVSSPDPWVVYHTRASECTKRMIFDFLLVQKIIEYVYGPNKRVEVKMFIPFCFIAIEGFLLYSNYRPFKKCLNNFKDPDKQNIVQRRILQAYEKFSTIDIDSIKYRVHQRSATGIQRGLDGKPLHGRKPYLAKDISLFLTKKQSRDIAKLDSEYERHQAAI